MIKKTFNDVAKYTGVSKIPYNIIAYLMQDDDLWKLLNYTDNNALNEAPLTNQQKRDLIYTGNSGDSSVYNVFLQAYVDDSSDAMVTQLRVFQHKVQPISSYNGKVDIEFQILGHDKILMVKNGGIIVNRLELIEEKLIADLNGKNFGGVSNMEFTNNNGSDVAIYTRFNTRMYGGYIMRMTCQVG